MSNLRAPSSMLLSRGNLQAMAGKPSSGAPIAPWKLKVNNPSHISSLIPGGPLSSPSSSGSVLFVRVLFGYRRREELSSCPERIMWCKLKNVTKNSSLDDDRCPEVSICDMVRTIRVSSA